MCDPTSSIASLVPLSLAGTTALTYEHNQSWVESIPFPTLEALRNQRRSRQSTPSVELTERIILLSLLTKPFDPVLGFSFGSDSEKCDILLNDRVSEHGISRVHFRINFNLGSKALMLTDVSSNFTVINSKNLGRVVLSQQSIAIQSGDAIQAGHAMFRLQIPERGKHMDEYNRNLDRCILEIKNAIPRMESLNVQQKQHNTYLNPKDLYLIEEAGCGASAKVHKAVDAFGFTYAVKVYRESGGDTVQTEISRAISREIEAFKSFDHPHIVRCIQDKVVPDLDGRPHIIMEYVDLGNLEDLLGLSAEETTVMIHQVLDATLYIHVNGYSHRDIKPANILVKSLSPFHVQLADFGFTSKGLLKTICGSYCYAAPEIFSAYNDPDPEYTSAVDIWAIGVVLLQFCTSLPSAPHPFNAATWFHRLQACITSALSKETPYLSLLQLAENMLNKDFQERPLAQTCLSTVGAIRRGEHNVLKKLKRKASSVGDEQRRGPSLRGGDRLKGALTKETLELWINRDVAKAPSIAINLSKICFHLGLSRDSYRQSVMKVPSYIIKGQNTPPRGTYVSLEFAAGFVEQNCPDSLVSVWIRQIKFEELGRSPSIVGPITDMPAVDLEPLSQLFGNVFD